jgi:DNA-binding FadR family transcriptional regulator
VCTIHIVAHIERAIYDGRLECGDKLPPERELGTPIRRQPRGGA